MTAQLALLDAKGRVHRHGHDTEHRAANGGQRRVLLRDAVMRLLREHPEGLTDDEGAALLPTVLDARMSFDRLDFGRRRNELQKDGYVVKTSERRPTPHGKSAIVWKAVQ